MSRDSWARNYYYKRKCNGLGQLQFFLATGRVYRGQHVVCEALPNLVSLLITKLHHSTRGRHMLPTNHLTSLPISYLLSSSSALSVITRTVHRKTGRMIFSPTHSLPYSHMRTASLLKVRTNNCSLKLCLNKRSLNAILEGYFLYSTVNVTPYRDWSDLPWDFMWKA